MTVNFPAIQPTACSYTPPRFPVTESVSKSGVRSYRIWGNKRSDGFLDLTFENKTQSETAAILGAFNDAKGMVEDLNLPGIIFNSITDASLLQEFSQSGSGLKWYFINDEPPPVERVQGGRRYTTRVRLRAELRFG